MINNGFPSNGRNGRLVGFQANIGETQLELLRLVATASGQSISGVIRRAIDREFERLSLTRRGRPKKQPTTL